MMKTPPRFADLHPLLREKIYKTAALHEKPHPERLLVLIWGHRSVAEQLKAYGDGFSKLDGVRKVSYHNYLPSLAADLWVYTDGAWDSAEVIEGRPPKDKGFVLQLMERRAFRTFYRPLGKIARKVGLKWGGSWGDGPHFQLSRRDRIKAVQDALQRCGFAPGPIDGVHGPKTRAAIRAAVRASGIKNEIEGWWRRRSMPVLPPLWAWLHAE